MSAHTETNLATETGLPSNYRPTNCPNYTPPVQSKGRTGYNLFVGTLPNQIVKEDLEILFSPFGALADTYLLKQEGKGRWRCGFVSFVEYSSAAHAIARLNGFKVNPETPPMCVRFANPLKPSDIASPAVSSTTAAAPRLPPAPECDDASSLSSSLGHDTATPENTTRPFAGPSHVAGAFSLHGLILPMTMN
eukprot:TRINITY_DN1288_c0_g2_i1.p3 TRINITY_DN1288_c0_g2~~TRINITY_DN1288_c0_g2_i1.p3  ORF type:complete len:192 (+),score=36.03 TRINITY_DN1288_c0_g2_i1:58-633(+)